MQYYFIIYYFFKKIKNQNEIEMGQISIFCLKLPQVLNEFGNALSHDLRTTVRLYQFSTFLCNPVIYLEISNVATGSKSFITVISYLIKKNC
jgi:hypothetical protein